MRRSVVVSPVVMVSSVAGFLADSVALTWALVVCVLQLVFWGFVAGRRAYGRTLFAVLSGIVNGLLGLILVVLETIVLH